MWYVKYNYRSTTIISAHFLSSILFNYIYSVYLLCRLGIFVLLHMFYTASWSLQSTLASLLLSVSSGRRIYLYIPSNPSFSYYHLVLPFQMSLIHHFFIVFSSQSYQSYNFPSTICIALSFSCMSNILRFVHLSLNSSK